MSPRRAYSGRRYRRRRSPLPALLLVMVLAALVLGALAIFTDVFKKDKPAPAPDDPVITQPDDGQQPNDGTDGQGGEDGQQPDDTQQPTGNKTLDTITTDATPYQSGGVYVVGDTGFEMYSYVDSLAKNYADIVNSVADQLTGVSTVYAMAVPLSSGITLPDALYSDIPGSDQAQAEKDILAAMGNNVKTVPLHETLMAHRGEYIYFRTDHHWTALGAYYAYQAICQATDQTPAPLDSFTPWDQGTFTGSLYGQARWPRKLKKDDCIAYIPQGDITMMVKDKGSFQEMPLLRDMTKGNENEKYVTFLSSDHALCEITNNSLPEGTACLLVKDSFGNCLAPFLTQNYHKVYAMDYRKYGVSGLKYFVENNEVQDVIFSPYLIATQSILGNDLISGLCN